MKREFHVRFRENAGVKFPCVTRLAVMLKPPSLNRDLQILFNFTTEIY